MSNDIQRLADYVKARRESLDLRQDQMAERGGPSTTTLTKVENATPPAPANVTLRKLDRSLGWAPGSSAKILAGGSPILLAGVVPESRIREYDEAADRDEARAGVTANPSAQPEMDRMLRLMREGRADEIPEGAMRDLADRLTVERFLAGFQYLDLDTQLQIADFAGRIHFAKDNPHLQGAPYANDTTDADRQAPSAGAQGGDDEGQKTGLDAIADTAESLLTALVDLIANPLATPDLIDAHYHALSVAVSPPEEYVSEVGADHPALARLNRVHTEALAVMERKRGGLIGEESSRSALDAARLRFAGRALDGSEDADDEYEVVGVDGAGVDGQHEVSESSE